MKKIVVLKVKDGLETRFRNMKPLKNLPISYAVFKDGEKRQFHLRPTGDARLLGLTLKGVCVTDFHKTWKMPVSFCSEVKYNFLLRETLYITR